MKWGFYCRYRTGKPKSTLSSFQFKTNLPPAKTALSTPWIQATTSDHKCRASCFYNAEVCVQGFEFRSLGLGVPMGTLAGSRSQSCPCGPSGSSCPAR